MAFFLVFSIKCWDCNSAINPKCADPFDDANFAMADCNQKTLARYPDKHGVVCRKIIQKSMWIRHSDLLINWLINWLVNDDYRYIRGCGYLREDKESDGPEKQSICYKRAGTFSVLTEYCSCVGDGCNHAGHAIVSCISIVIPLIIRLIML